MRKILPWMSINGKIVSKEKVKISVFDYGVQYGYGVFTTLKVREGIPLFIEKHIQRLQNSLQTLSFSKNPLASDIKKSVLAVIHKNMLTDGGIRITITRGLEDKITVLIHATTIDREIQTVSVITIFDKRDGFKTLKMIYRVPNILAQQQAHRQGAQDALFIQEDNLIESTYANIYSYSFDGKVITPPIKNRGLNGISRQVLMGYLSLQEQDVSKNTTDPMVLISSLSMRVVEKINERLIKQDKTFVLAVQTAIDTAEKEYIHAKPLL